MMLYMTSAPSPYYDIWHGNECFDKVASRVMYNNHNILSLHLGGGGGGGGGA